MSDDRTDWYLYTWERWMRGSKTMRLAFPSRASGGMGSSGSLDFDQMADAAEIRCAEATDSCIDELQGRDRMAIYATHLAGQWTPYAPDLPHCYANAKQELGRRLDKHGMV